MTLNFSPELSGVFNGKPEFDIPHDYYEVVHEDPLCLCCNDIQDIKPSFYSIVFIFIEYSIYVQDEATDLAYKIAIVDEAHPKVDLALGLHEH